jgi:hypothetical protein
MSQEERKMIQVYIAHRYGGATEMRERAARWFAYACEVGYAPVAPWIVLTLVWDESRREDGLKINFEHIEQCHELWICGEGEISPGMQFEITHAKMHGVRVEDLRTADGEPPTIPPPSISELEGQPLGMMNPGAGKYTPQQPIEVADERKAPGAE